MLRSITFCIVGVLVLGLGVCVSLWFCGPLYQAEADCLLCGQSRVVEKRAGVKVRDVGTATGTSEWTDQFLPTHDHLWSKPREMEWAWFGEPVDEGFVICMGTSFKISGDRGIEDISAYRSILADITLRRLARRLYDRVGDAPADCRMEEFRIVMDSIVEEIEILLEYR